MPNSTGDYNYCLLVIFQILEVLFEHEWSDRRTEGYQVGHGGSSCNGIFSLYVDGKQRSANLLALVHREGDKKISQQKETE